MHASHRSALAAIGAAALVVVAAPEASAQTIGTFPFALAPYCNTVSLTVTAEGATYRLAGWDDNCGAGNERFPLVGTISPNNDGTLHIAFSIIRNNGIAVATSVRNFNLGNYQGTWTDSAGNTGIAGIIGLSAPAQGPTPRPAPVSTLAANSVNTVNIVDASVNAVDVNSAEVQLRVNGTCPAGQAVRSIDQGGNVACGPAASAVVQGSEVSLVNGITNTCEELDGVNFANAPAGILSCTAVVTTNFDHTNGTIDHLEFDIVTSTNACGGLQRSVYEMPAEAPTSAGNDISVTVHRYFGAVAAGPLTLYLNGRTAGTAANVLASQLTCTVVPQ
jgi:hypothetical protein